MNRLAAEQLRLADAEATFHAAVQPGPGSVRLPWPSLHGITRRIPRGEVVLVAGRTGNGKTTLTNSLINVLVQDGVGCYVIPTETTAKDWTKRFVCARLGESYAYWATELWKDELASGTVTPEEVEARRDALNADHATVAANPLLWVKPIRFANLHDIPLYYAEAAAAGLSVVLLDHVDLVRGETQDRYAVSTAALDAIIEAGQTHGLVSIVCSQTDGQLVKGSVLDQYAPPTLGNVYMGQHKNHAAAVVLGLFRPRKPGLTKADIQRINEKVDSPLTGLVPNRMGVVVSKHRFGEGVLEGQRCWLAVERGIVRERTPEEVAADQREQDAAQLTAGESTTRPPTRRGVP